MPDSRIRVGITDTLFFTKFMRGNDPHTSGIYLKDYPDIEFHICSQKRYLEMWTALLDISKTHVDGPINFFIEHSANSLSTLNNDIRMKVAVDLHGTYTTNPEFFS